VVVAHEQKLFYEDELDALRATVQALGGYKAVGAKLWPDQTTDVAGRKMADACNPSRQERLKPSQVLMVMRLGREAGVHILAEHFMLEAGYKKPEPVVPEDEAASLVAKVDELLGTAGQLVARLERVRRVQA
jgi:hypothetical protein